MKTPRCEGWRRHGGAFTLGPVKWEQCPSEATVMLTVKQQGETQTMPACNTCWQECIENKIEIVSAEPITTNAKIKTATSKV